MSLPLHIYRLTVYLKTLEIDTDRIVVSPSKIPNSVYESIQILLFANFSKGIMFQIGLSTRVKSSSNEFYFVRNNS